MHNIYACGISTQAFMCPFTIVGTDIDYGWCHFGKIDPSKGSGLRFAAMAGGNIGDYPGCG